MKILAPDSSDRPIPENSNTDALLRRLLSSVGNNTDLSGRYLLLSCSLPQRPEHLMTNDLQETIFGLNKTEGAVLQKAYSHLKLTSMREVAKLVAHKIKSKNEFEEVALLPILEKTSNWISSIQSGESFKTYFVEQLLDPFASYLHAVKTTTPSHYAQDPFVHSIFHIQQKFFMIDNLSTTKDLELTDDQKEMFRKVLVVSLQKNLRDFVDVLKIIASLEVTRNVQQAS